MTPDDERKIQEGAEWTPDDYGTESGYRATPSAPPSPAPKPSGIDHRILDHRAMYAADVHIPRLVARQPPTTLDPNTGALHVEDGTRIGMTMSGRLLRYVGHPEGYGSSFPWSRALWQLRVECRRAHPSHRRADAPYWRGSLCHELVKLTVISGWSLENAAKILRYDDAERVLRQAFDFMEERIDHAREKAERRAREEQGHGPGAVPRDAPVHHVPSHEHIAECPNPECRKRRAA